MTTNSNPPQMAKSLRQTSSQTIVHLMVTLQLRQPECVWSNPKLKGRIPELDGVRGLAILLVLIEHYISNAPHLHLARWQAYVLIPFRLSWSGVDLFFVLSGFLIGGILIDARGASNYYAIFYARRVHRIFPLYYLWFLFFLIGLRLSSTMNQDSVRMLFNRDLPAWSYPIFFQNFAMSLRRGTGPMWLGITWSLAVEEQFYMILPWAIRKLSNRGILRLAGAAIVIAPALRVVLLRSGSGPLAPYTLLPCRADALGFGVLIAVVLRDKSAWMWLESHRKPICLLFLTLGATLCLLTRQSSSSPLFMGLGFSLLAAFYASLLVLVIVNPGRMESLALRWTPLVSLGTVSYAVYIIHPAVSYLLHGAILGRQPSFDDWPSILVTLLSLATVLLLAGLSWRLMEKPMIDRAHSKFRYSRQKLERTAELEVEV